jgi:hypothetical protein
MEEGDGDAGKAGSGAEVEEGFGLGVDMLRGEEAFAEVTADDLFGVTDGGEVGAGVPLEKKVEVEGEFGDQIRGMIGHVGGQERGDGGF